MLRVNWKEYTLENKKISVIMGIYNCEKTLAEALECIITQTYENWEIIMCDDGSSDGTVKVAKEYIEKYPDRIFLLRNKKNIGLNKTLNKCLKVAKGDYVARMDGDDLCSKNRFEKEVEILNKCPEIAIVSTDMEFFDENGVWGKTHVIKYPQKKDFVKATQFCHAACMVRREAYQAVDGYSIAKNLLRVEDYHLWVKMYAKGYRGVNIQETLYSMRDDRNAQSRRKFKYRLNEAYVKFYAVNVLGLPQKNYIFCLRPIIIGLLLKRIYKVLHRSNR